MGLKGSSIVVVIASFFLMTIVCFDSSLPLLIAVIIFMLGYSYWKWKNKNMATAEINDFVASYIKPEKVWPSKVVIPKERLDEINLKLSEKKVVLPQATLNKMVEDTLVKKIELRFETSFYEHNEDLPQNPSRSQWIQAYIRTFNKNMDYVPILQRLMKKKGARIPIKALTEKINEEMSKQRAIKKKNKSQS